MGRPSKFTPDRLERILQALRTTGCTLRAAAAAGGVSESLLMLWLQRGREAETGPYRQFLDDAQEAIAAGEQLLAAKVAAAGDKDWRAAAWLLERRFPHSYAPQVALLRHVEKLSDAELQVLIEEQLRQLPAALPCLPDPTAPAGAGGAGAAEEPIDADFRIDS